MLSFRVQWTPLWSATGVDILNLQHGWKSQHFPSHTITDKQAFWLHHFADINEN
jgi:hypothetical protein